MTAEATVQDIIDSALSAADEAQNDADTYATQAVNAASLLATPSDPPEIGEPVIPALSMPSVDLGDLFEGESDARADELRAMVESELSDFINDYFPGSWISKLQTIGNWIEESISNGGTGLSPAVEQAIWDRAREREGRLNERSNEEAASVPASLGWPLPTAATANRQLRSAHDNINRDSSLSREIMIEQARLEQSNIRFAVSNGLALHSQIMSAALNFIQSKLRAEALGQQYGQILEGATANFYTQTLQYYRAKLQGEQLELRQDIAEVDRSLSTSRLSIESINAKARNLTDAAMSAARVMGDIAASARSTTNTMTSLAHETTATE